MNKLLLGLGLLISGALSAQIDTLYNKDLTRTVCIDTICKELRCDHGLDLHTFEIWNGDFGGYTLPSKTNGFYLGTIGVQLTLLTEENHFWKNGKFSLFMLNNYGMNPSANEIGDFQVFNNMEAPGNKLWYINKKAQIDYRNFFYTFYYEHTFKNLRLLVGQYDINYDFANSTTGFNFLNSSFGASPAITVNVPSFATYPFTTLAARAEYNFKDRYIYRAAITEGSGGNQYVNLHGNKYNFEKNEGAMILNEFELRKMKGEIWNSSIKFGVWNHTGSIFYNRLDTTGTEIVKGNFGAYLIADSRLTFEKVDSAQGLSGFMVLDYVPGKQNFFNYSIGGGLSYCGLFKNRAEDILSIGAFMPIVNKDLQDQQGYAQTEIEAEINYNIKLNAFINLQPCLQYIIQPGAMAENIYTDGIQSRSYNPFVFMMRFTVRNGLFR